jgi:hypothetical protein
LAFCQGNPGRRSLPGWPTYVISPPLYTVKTHVKTTREACNPASPSHSLYWQRWEVYK